MADKARTNLRFQVELQHVEPLHPDGSIDEAAILYTRNDPGDPSTPVKNVLLRVSTGDEELRRWIDERPGDWTVTLTPPKG